MNENLNEQVFDNEEVVETPVEEVKKPTATKKASPKESSKDREISDLKAQVEALTALVAQMAAGQNKTEPTYVSDDVTLVYMSESMGVVQAGNTELMCTKFGENFTLSRHDFDAVVGKYRHWFDKGILAVSPKDIKVAAAKGLKTSDEYYLSSEILNKVARLSCNDLEELWNNIDTVEQKRSLVEYFKKKLIEGVDPAFRDRAKIELLNRLTSGGFKREVKEVSGDDLKIRPIEM